MQKIHQTQCVAGSQCTEIPKACTSHVVQKATSTKMVNQPTESQFHQACVVYLLDESERMFSRFFILMRSTSRSVKTHSKQTCTITTKLATRRRLFVLANPVIRKSYKYLELIQ